MIVECAWCNAQWEGTPQQAGYVRNGKNVFCPGGYCKNEWQKKQKANPKTSEPWGWLRCRHILNELPTQDPSEIYVGY